MTAIIILNWNGANDTICCLDSLSKAEGSFFVVVADNGSNDDSLVRLREYVNSSTLDIRILELGHNYGFAAGNNKAVVYASQFNPDAYLLLNNDTEVNPDFLERLIEFQKENAEFKVLTPRINLFYTDGHIWNCGGTLFLGFRKYRYAGCNESVVGNRKWDRITFVTGCALFFLPEILNNDKHILTERFFFGEEDFDFSLRMKREHVSMACVYDSVIYHKVGASAKSMNMPGKVYLHLLNRYVNIRLNSNVLSFMAFRLMNFPFALRSLKRANGSWKQAVNLYPCLLRDAKTRQGVTQEDFVKLVITGDYDYAKIRKS